MSWAGLTRGRVTVVAGALVLVSLGAYRTVARSRDEVARIEPGGISRSIVARAAVVPKEGVSEIRTRIDATVLKVLVREGEQVKAGQVLAQLEAREREFAVARAKAEVSVLEAALAGQEHGGRREARRELSAMVNAAEQEVDLAEREAKRSATLHASGSISDAQATRADIDVEMARARLEATRARFDSAKHGGPDEVRAARHRLDAARAELEAATEELERATIRAPTDGVILSRHVDPGDVVRSLDLSVLFELANTEQLELRGEVEELQAPFVRVGAAVKITAAGGVMPLCTGKVSRMAPGVGHRAIAGDPSELRADSLVRAVYVELDPGTTLELPLGQRVEIRISLGTEPVRTRVPRAAVTLENGRATVMVRSGLIDERRQVQLGLADDQNVQVLGVPAGTEVVLNEASAP